MISKSSGEKKEEIKSVENSFDTFSVSKKLYGREKEKKILLNVLSRVFSGKKEILFCSGEPGIGKTSLINELNKHSLLKNGFFITGKFDLLNRSIPYAPIIQAFQRLAGLLLTYNEETLNIWKEKILKAVGANGRVITDVIPLFEQITGKQPEVFSLPSTESQNRFNIVFHDFIKVFAAEEHPLVLFIDDMQWIDNASLKLLEMLFEETEMKYFLIAGAYRSNEVDSYHVFSGLLNKLKKMNLQFNNILLKSLSYENITEFVLDTFHCDKTDAIEFSKVIVSKSNGNPFYFLEYLKMLNKEEVIKFENGWKWDIEKIKKSKITDNVVELMSEKIEKLPEEALVILKIVCSVGIKVSLNILSMVMEKDAENIVKDLKDALSFGVIVKTENEIMFVHDRIQEACYSLIEENEKAETHYKIGKSFLKQNDEKLIEENIFTIALQLNLSKNILNEKEKNDLLDFNSRAGIKAKLSCAFESALGFFKNALDLLPEDSWKNNYDLTLKIYTEIAECEYVAANFDGAKYYFDIILKESKSFKDDIPVYEIMLYHYTTVMSLDKAVDLGVMILNELGIKFQHPDKMKKSDIEKNYERFCNNIKDKTNEDLINLPVLTDQNKIYALSILPSLIVPFWGLYPDFASAVPLEIVNISIENGIYPPTAVGLVILGMFLNTSFGKPELGYNLGLAGLEIQKKFNYRFLESMVMFSFHNMVSHWKKPYKDSLKGFLEAYKTGLENGNNQWASYCINHYCFFNVWMGTNLIKLKECFDSFTDRLTGLKQSDSDVFFNIGKQFTYNMFGFSKNSFILAGDCFNENKEVPVMIENKFYPGVAVFYTFKIALLTILGNYKKALEYARNGEQIILANDGQPQVEIFMFYSGITYSQNYERSGVNEKKQYQAKIEHIKTQYKTWAENCRDNFSHKYYLLEAESARINNDSENAVKYYEFSIQAAKKYEFLHIEALANELLGLYNLSRKNDGAARKNLVEARYLYSKWGAKAKMEEMDKTYFK
jgi:predicted ATPase